MTALSLDVRILKNDRKFQDITITADPDDTPAIQASLKNWLEGGRWDRKLWSQFSAEVSYRNKILKTVRL